jgi:phosphate starvation-inducible PhoH-like protein
MAKRNNLSVVESRRDRKKERGYEPNVKFDEEKKTMPLQAKTEAQEFYIESLNNNIITIATGHAGSGKSYCASYLAAQMLLRNEIEYIVITRPYAHLGTDYGATPGTDFEKLEPFCRPMLDTLKKVLGPARYQYCIDKKIIEISPLEKIQGRSFDDPCAIICDESQNATKPQLLSLVTRLGTEVEFLAICGDPRQSVRAGENALDWVTDFFDRNNIQSVGVVEFTEEDCVRSGIVKDILIAFEREGGFYSKM